MPLKQQLFSFSGRLNRAPYWILYIATWLVLGAIIFATGGAAAVHGGQAGGGSAIGGLISLVVCIAWIWIALALNIKRFHDRDKSGWWVLIGLIPVIGALWILIECGFLPGTPGDNRFGSNPVG
jgi:uncharacterized membrane protein YhaH (DUF805 family)